MWRLATLLLALASREKAQDSITAARNVDPSTDYAHGALPEGRYSGLDVISVRDRHRVRLEGQFSRTPTLAWQIWMAKPTGDSVTFRHADRGHDVNSYDAMRPDGAAVFRGRPGEEFSVTFDVPGTYGYFCRPHQMMGMVGFILGGAFTGNLGDVREAVAGLRAPPLKRRADDLLAQVDAIARDEGLT